MSEMQIATLVLGAVSLVLVLLTPYQIRSTYYAERKADGDWWLIQTFYVFGLKWYKGWEISDEIGDWVDLKTQRRVPSWRSEWLSGLCIKKMNFDHSKANLNQ